MHRTDTAYRYRILLVAPSGAGLPEMGREVAAIVGLHDVNLLMGHVTEDDLAREAGRGGYDIIWFVTHCDGQCVVVDGRENGTEGICSDSLVAYVAASGASLCVLNTCQSVGIARQIYQSTDADVICTVADPNESNPNVLDKDAMRTGVLFAGQLAARGDYREAYERSKPGSNRSYLYLENRDRMAAQTPTQQRDTGEEPLSGRSLLMAQLARLETGIGDVRHAQNQTTTDIAVLRRDLDAGMKGLSERMERLERNGNGNGSGIPLKLKDWAIIFVAVFISLLVSFTIYTASAGR